MASPLTPSFRLTSFAQPTTASAGKVLSMLGRDKIRWEFAGAAFAQRREEEEAEEAARRRSLARIATKRRVQEYQELSLEKSLTAARLEMPPPPYREASRIDTAEWNQAEWGMHHYPERSGTVGPDWICDFGDGMDSNGGMLSNPLPHLYRVVAEPEVYSNQQPALRVSRESMPRIDVPRDATLDSTLSNPPKTLYGVSPSCVPSSEYRRNRGFIVLDGHLSEEDTRRKATFSAVDHNPSFTGPFHYLGLPPDDSSGTTDTGTALELASRMPSTRPFRTLELPSQYALSPLLLALQTLPSISDLSDPVSSLSTTSSEANALHTKPTAMSDSCRGKAPLVARSGPIRRGSIFSVDDKARHSETPLNASAGPSSVRHSEALSQLPTVPWPFQESIAPHDDALSSPLQHKPPLSSVRPPLIIDRVLTDSPRRQPPQWFIDASQPDSDETIYGEAEAMITHPQDHHLSSPVAREVTPSPLYSIPSLRNFRKQTLDTAQKDFNRAVKGLSRKGRLQVIDLHPCSPLLPTTSSSPSLNLAGSARIRPFFDESVPNVSLSSSFSKSSGLADDDRFDYEAMSSDVDAARMSYSNDGLDTLGSSSSRGSPRAPRPLATAFGGSRLMRLLGTRAC